MPGPPSRLRVHQLVEANAASREAPPLVLLHGFTGDSTTWLELLEHLGRERRVVGVDLPGHGDSLLPASRADYTMPVCAALVEAAVAGLGGGRAHLLGYSMGGRVALHVAARRKAPLASLVLVGASPGLAEPAARRRRIAEDEELARFIEERGLEAFVDRWMRHPLFATQERLGAAHLVRARAQRLQNSPAGLASCLRGMGAGAMEPLWHRLNEFGLPALVVVGELDTKFKQIGDRMVELMPNAEFRCVPDAGHAVHLEAPEALGREVRGFLARIEGTS